MLSFVFVFVKSLQLLRILAITLVVWTVFASVGFVGFSFEIVSLASSAVVLSVFAVILPEAVFQS